MSARADVEAPSALAIAYPIEPGTVCGQVGAGRLQSPSTAGLTITATGSAGTGAGGAGVGAGGAGVGAGVGDGRRRSRGRRCRGRLGWRWRLSWARRHRLDRECPDRPRSCFCHGQSADRTQRRGPHRRRDASSWPVGRNIAAGRLLDRGRVGGLRHEDRRSFIGRDLLQVGDDRRRQDVGSGDRRRAEQRDDPRRGLRRRRCR